MCKNSRLLILLLYEKIYINLVKTFQESDRMENHKTRDNTDSYSHLLWFARGLYMLTATLLNGQLFNGGLKILLFSEQIFRLTIPIKHNIYQETKYCLLQAPRYTKIKHKIIADINFMHVFFDHARCFRQLCPS